MSHSACLHPVKLFPLVRVHSSVMISSGRTDPGRERGEKIGGTMNLMGLEKLF